MKRNFSQPFEKEPSLAFLLVQDALSHKFVLLNDTPGQDAGYQFTRLPRLSLGEGETVHQLAKHLHKQGFAAKAFRELARFTSLSYSFVDDTPGVTHDTICYQVVVDQTIRLGKLVYGQQVEWLPLPQFATALSGDTVPQAVRVGVGQLAAEELLSNPALHPAQ